MLYLNTTQICRAHRFACSAMDKVVQGLAANAEESASASEEMIPMNEDEFKDF